MLWAFPLETELSGGINTQLSSPLFDPSLNGYTLSMFAISYGHADVPILVICGFCLCRKPPGVREGACDI